MFVTTGRNYSTWVAQRDARTSRERRTEGGYLSHRVGETSVGSEASMRVHPASGKRQEIHDFQ
jgi:hypothetical protein